MPEDNVIEREYYVNIDSTDRDRTLWADSGNFEVKMQPDGQFKGTTINRSFKNVKSKPIPNAITAISI